MKEKTHKQKWIPKYKMWSITWALCGAFIYNRTKKSVWWRKVDCRKCLKKGGKL